MNDDFVYIKSNNNNKNNNEKNNIKYDKNTIKDKIKKILINNGAKAAFLFGSYARNEKYPNDIDILVIWYKTIGIPENINEIYTNISNEINYRIDLINMIYNGKKIFFDSRCKYFILDNIYPEAITIFNNSNNNKYIIKMSNYIGKV